MRSSTPPSRRACPSSWCVARPIMRRVRPDRPLAVCFLRAKSSHFPSRPSSSSSASASTTLHYSRTPPVPGGHLRGSSSSLRRHLLRMSTGQRTRAAALHQSLAHLRRCDRRVCAAAFGALFAAIFSVPEWWGSMRHATANHTTTAANYHSSTNHASTSVRRGGGDTRCEVSVHRSLLRVHLRPKSAAALRARRVHLRCDDQCLCAGSTGGVQ